MTLTYRKDNEKTGDVLIKIIKSINYPKMDRVYHLADTSLGQILFYQFGDYTQWRNLTEQDCSWTLNKTLEFKSIYEESSAVIEIFTNERINGFSKNNAKIDVDGETIKLCTKKKCDGYIYQVPSSMLRTFSKKNYSEYKFVYTKYKISSVLNMDVNQLERLITEETVKFNDDKWAHSTYLVSLLAEKVHKFAKSYIALLAKEDIPV